jgi:hypothetical protein
MRQLDRESSRPPLLSSQLEDDMSKHTSLTLASVAFAAMTLAACQDSATSTPLGVAQGPRMAATTTVGDTTYTSFRVDPKDNRMIVLVGTHKLDIPPGSICDPATSGYGPTLWDAPCTPAASGVDFVAKTWTDAAGHPRLDITPDVRFVPGAVVTIYLKDRQAALDATSNIAWCPTGGAACYNESLNDPSLAPSRDGTNGWISRRVKHFSGYNVVFGFDSEFSSSQLSLQLDGTLQAERASGYITTTGRSAVHGRRGGRTPR